MNLEQRLHAVLAPCEPGPAPLAAVMARLTSAQPTRIRRRAPRLILFGTLLAVAAAAGMFAVFVSGSHEQAGILSSAPSIVPAESVPAAQGAEQEVHAATTPVAVEPQPAGISVAAPLRTVLLRPLQIVTDNADAQAAARQFYTRLVEELRAIPGLVVLPDESAGSAGTPVDFRLTLTGSADDGGAEQTLVRGEEGRLILGMRRQPASRAARNWQMQIAVEGLRQQAGERALQSTVMTSGPLHLDCSPGAGTRGMCRSPAVAAAGLAEQLHLKFLPTDTQFSRSLQARVLDAGQSWPARFEALELLARTGSDADLTPDIIHAAFDLIASQPIPYFRSRILDLLHDRRQPELRHALIDMSVREPDTAVRLQALSLLAADHRADPAARTALQSIAANDPLPVARQVARRAISDAGDWNAYVVANIQDPTLSPAERFAPLAYMVQNGQKAEARALLDEKVITALVGVLPPLVDDTTGGVSAAIDVLAALGDVNSPSVIDLMLASLDKARTTTSRYFIVQGLGRFHDDPRVRTVLERISASDAEPRLQEMAAESLQQPAARATPYAITAGQPPRLGVQLRGLLPLSELVGDPAGGKAIVTAVGAGTVAEKAGMRDGDVLLEINGTPIQSPEQVPEILQSVPRGVAVDVLVHRAERKVTLKARF